MTTTATTVAVDRHWELFCDWCAATDRQALPASEVTILGFLTEIRAGPATVRRRLQAIDSAHLAAGHPPPTMRLEAAGPPAPSRFPAELVATVLATPPIGGWPVGLAGQRDTALLAVAAAGGLTRRQALALTTTSTAGPVAPVTERPAACPACALRRWQITLATVADAGWRSVRLQLAEQGETTGADKDGHDCRHDTDHRQGSARPVPLFCPIDRHGVPETGRQLSARAVTAILARALERASSLSRPTDHYQEPVGPWDAADRARAGAARRDAGDRLAALESTIAGAEAYADAVLDRLAAALGDT